MRLKNFSWKLCLKQRTKSQGGNKKTIHKIKYLGVLLFIEDQRILVLLQQQPLLQNPIHRIKELQLLLIRNLMEESMQFPHKPLQIKLLSKFLTPFKEKVVLLVNIAKD
jgi:hypothetical protein